MGVVYHGFDWSPTERDLASIGTVIAAAQAHDGGALRALGVPALQRAVQGGDRLAAFGLGDHAYVDGWLSVDAVHPALVALLILAPVLDPLTGPAAAALGRQARSALTGDIASAGFTRFSAVFVGWSGPTTFDHRALPVELGLWRGDAGEATGGMPRVGDRWQASTAIW
ncbi:hypothetical protein [Sphingomonas bacterium]|uniref:hypothetical protein n=1 Tax=Sphingomonas bacterium TaxID=1895847 RepID=UPI0015750DE5|nr:hypothetical protein [Sphingomonas bacterium]